MSTKGRTARTSHIGGHFNDWLTTEQWAMVGRKTGYLVVFNEAYSMIFDHLLPK